MSAIDHQAKRIQTLLRTILNVCENVKTDSADALRRFEMINEAARSALAYIPAPPVGEWIDITTNSDYGFRVEINTATGERRHIPVEPRRKTMVLSCTGEYAPVMSEQFKHNLRRDFPNTDIEVMHVSRDLNPQSRTYRQVISKLVGVIYGDDRERNKIQSDDDQAPEGYKGS